MKRSVVVSGDFSALRLLQVLARGGPRMPTTSVPARRLLGTLLAAAGLLAGTAGAALGSPVRAATANPNIAAAPYEYFGWGNPQDPVDVMNKTGVRWLTVAFILSDG